MTRIRIVAILLIALMLALLCFLVFGTKITNETKDNPNINKTRLGELVAEYQCVDYTTKDEQFGSFWHLSILDDYEGKPYFSIYDNEAGNPGIEGEIVALDDSMLSIQYDASLFEELPSKHWSCQDEVLQLNYEVTERGVILTNSDVAIYFKNEEAEDQFSLFLNTGDSHDVKSFSLTEEYMMIDGDYRVEEGEWSYWKKTDCPTSYFVAPDCVFYDGIFEQADVSIEHFLELLQRDKVKSAVIVFHQGEEGISELQIKKKE